MDAYLDAIRRTAGAKFELERLECVSSTMDHSINPVLYIKPLLLNPSYFHSDHRHKCKISPLRGTIEDGEQYRSHILHLESQWINFIGEVCCSTLVLARPLHLCHTLNKPGPAINARQSTNSADL